MAGISPQAQKVITALLAVGVPRKDFSVRTERTPCTYVNSETGVRERYIEYGDATAAFYTKAALQQAIERAEDLAGMELSVHVHSYAECGHDLTILVWSARNGDKRVGRTVHPGFCPACRT